MLKSNFLELSSADRHAIESIDPLLSRTADMWFDVERTSPFDVVTKDEWWQPPEGFHHVPSQFSSGDLWPHVLSLEEAATKLSKAAYPARKQSARVADAAFLFVGDLATFNKLKGLFLFEKCLESEGCPLIPLVQQRRAMHGEPFLVALRETLRLLPAHEIDEETSSEADLAAWAAKEFPAWVTDFTLELARWKSVPNVEAMGGGHE